MSLRRVDANPNAASLGQLYPELFPGGLFASDTGIYRRDIGAYRKDRADSRHSIVD